MPKFSFQKCLQQIPSRYELVIVASKRAEQLLRGSRPRVRDAHQNPARTALQEISAGQILKNGGSWSYRLSVSEAPKKPPSD